jgi:hypothetical protein
MEKKLSRPFYKYFLYTIILNIALYSLSSLCLRVIICGCSDQRKKVEFGKICFTGVDWSNFANLEKLLNLQYHKIDEFCFSMQK